MRTEQASPESALQRSTLRYMDDDLTTNLSLQARLRGDFGITLPDVPEIEDLNPVVRFVNTSLGSRRHDKN